jgi:hypothetical protein
MAQKWIHRQLHPRVVDTPDLPCDTPVKVTLVARPLPMPVAQKVCRCEYGVLMIRMCGHSRTFLHMDIVYCCCGAFSNAYLTRTCLVKRHTTGNKTLGAPDVPFCDECSSSDRTAEIATKKCFSCSNGIRLQESDIAICFVVLRTRTLCGS